MLYEKDDDGDDDDDGADDDIDGQSYVDDSYCSTLY